MNDDYKQEYKEPNQIVKVLIFLWKIVICIEFLYLFHFIVFEIYIYPKLAKYYLQDADARHFKTGCARQFIDVSGRATGTYTFIDGKKYHFANIHFHVHVTKGAEKYTIPIYKKQAEFENDLKNNPKTKCHKVKYLSIIDLGFWKKFYLYDYIPD